MLKVSVNLALVLEEFISIHINIFWIMLVSWIDECLLCSIHNLIELFPSFGIRVNKCTSLRISFFMMLSTVVLKELMRGSCLNDWRHDIHECFCVMNIISFTNFKQVIEVLVVSLIDNPLIDLLHLFESESSWINSQKLLIFFITESFKMVWNGVSIVL
jgi:hypothetical protein